ncbi:hypothetical protein H6G81_19800 [Scytonema hofmannii FACHB-248]|uniref:Uncharacterized protein n=1 Tax=Scytonema hofmannii FACHB-248 TaxID=1842502 RepID=A0ABR8GTC2_9CYAN|nr:MULTISPECIES: hypothetical protein [Nostocales]MBD2606716.1 hypothetical protein [Scytonema hofmannii FACHB-248]
MRILEQTNNVLTLHQSSRNFWFETICVLFSSLFFMVFSCVIVSCGGWWGFLLLLLTAGVFYLALQNVWKSNVVKDCSFNKTLGRVTIKFHGLQTKIKDLPLQEIRAVEVRKRTGFAYGSVFENYELWLVTRYAKDILLSQQYYRNTLLEPLADQVREFLSLSVIRE